jgi:chemotaxis signal transduction protein
MKVVKCRISNLWVGIDVLTVDGVARCPGNYQEFRDTRDVVGFLPFHGRLVPLVELAPWLRVRGYFPGEERFVVVIDLVRISVGLIVGEVQGIVDVLEEPVLPLPGEGTARADLLRAVQTSEGLLHLVEPEVFFRHEDRAGFEKAVRREKDRQASLRSHS